MTVSMTDLLWTLQNGIDDPPPSGPVHTGNDSILGCL